MLNMSTKEVKEISSTWNDLGKSDPLWAVLSDREKRNRRWNTDEFFKTGEEVVGRYVRLIRDHAGINPPFGRVLDFGCGVGRLARAWAGYAEKVCGVDVAQSMIEGARKYNEGLVQIDFYVNEKSDLSLFENNAFDVVASHICLQHMSWPVAEKYIREFARVCKPSGVVLFQLPTRWLKCDWKSKFRQGLVDALPFGLGRRYRLWRHGTATTYEFHCTPLEIVEQAIRSSGMQLLHKDSDTSAGPLVESFVFVLKKP